MQILVTVVQLASEKWFEGKPDEREVPVLVCMDADKDKATVMKSSLDFIPSLDEIEAINLDALLMTRITIGCNGFRSNKAGRVRLTGKIDRSTLAKGALKSQTPVVVAGSNTSKAA